MRWSQALRWTLCVGLLAGLSFAPAPAAADPAKVTGTVAVYDDPDEGFVEIYIQNDDAEYRVSGGKAAELRKLDGKTVTATGKIRGDDVGDRVIEVEQFTVSE